MSYTTEQKNNYLSRLRDFSQKISMVYKDAMMLYQDYFDKGYNSGGSNELVQDDIDLSQFDGMTVAQITAIITSIESFKTYFDGGNDTNFSKITDSNVYELILNKRS